MFDKVRKTKHFLVIFHFLQQAAVQPKGTPACFEACDIGGAKLCDLVITYKASWASDVAVKLTVNIH